MSNTVVFHERPENVTLEDHVFVWHYTILDGSAPLTIRRGSQIGAWVGLFTHGSHIAIRLMGDAYYGFVGDRPGWPMDPLSIGPYAFVGAKSSVLPGCHVGRGALVSAHSLVTKPVPDFAIVSGSPAKVVGDVRDLDAKYIDPTSPWWQHYIAADAWDGARNTPS